MYTLPQKDIHVHCFRKIYIVTERYALVQKDIHYYIKIYIVTETYTLLQNYMHCYKIIHCYRQIYFVTKRSILLQYAHFIDWGQSQVPESDPETLIVKIECADQGQMKIWAQRLQPMDLDQLGEGELEKTSVQRCMSGARAPTLQSTVIQKVSQLHIPLRTKQLTPAFVGCWYLIRSAGCHCFLDVSTTHASL